MPPIAASFLARVPLERLSSPNGFAPLAARLVPRFAISALLLVVAAFVMSLLLASRAGGAPELWPLLFVHAPAEWMSLFLYALMTGWAVLSLGVRAQLPALMMVSLAPTGAMFSVLSLVTGLLVLGPGAGWWLRDAALGLQVILLGLYAGVVVLRGVAGDASGASRAQAALVLIGALNLPIIYGALRWWSTLQPQEPMTLASIRGMNSQMLAAMVVLALAFWTYANAVIIARARRLITDFDAISTARIEQDRG